MTVRLSSFNVSAFVGLAIGIATALPVTGPREFDRAVRTTRCSAQRSGSWGTQPTHGDDQAEPPAVASTEGTCVAGPDRASAQTPGVVAAFRVDAEVSPGTIAMPPGAGRLPRSAEPAPTGRAPPQA